VTAASDNVFPKVILEEGAAPATPSSGEVKLYAKTDGLLYSKDDAGTETLVSGGAGGGSGATGNVLIAMPFGVSLEDTSTTENTADRAYLMPITIPGAMKVRELLVRTTTGAAGTNEWGLFDYSSNSAACTKLAGGSGALNSTGWVSIAATSAPVDIDAGNYLLIFHLAASTQPTVRRATSGGASGPWVKFANTYTWDDTPDVTPGGAVWTEMNQPIHCMLVGDLDGSNQW
jgi:hypothetical protein